MANTLLLDTVAWDLVLDAQGNIALASEPYAIAQDVSSEARTFKGEVYYDTTKGVPYFQQILGKFPPASVMKSAYQQAAFLVPDVKTATVFLQADGNRELTGQIQVTDVNGNVLVAPTGPRAPNAPLFQAPSPPPFVPPTPATPGFGIFDFTQPEQSENTGLE